MLHMTISGTEGGLILARTKYFVTVLYLFTYHFSYPTDQVCKVENVAKNFNYPNQY